MKKGSNNQEPLLFQINGQWKPIIPVDKDITLSDTFVYKNLLSKKSDDVSAIMVGKDLKWLK